MWIKLILPSITYIYWLPLPTTVLPALILNFSVDMYLNYLGNIIFNSEINKIITL